VRAGEAREESEAHWRHLLGQRHVTVGRDRAVSRLAHAPVRSSASLLSNRWASKLAGASLGCGRSPREQVVPQAAEPARMGVGAKHPSFRQKRGTRAHRRH
jgi:hypothetical protein